MAMTPREALKGAKVLRYQRVSTTKQEGTLPTQERIVKELLKKEVKPESTFHWPALESNSEVFSEYM